MTFMTWQRINGTLLVSVNQLSIKTGHKAKLGIVWHHGTLAVAHALCVQQPMLPTA